VCLQDQFKDGENTDESLPTVNTLLVDTVTEDTTFDVIDKGAKEVDENYGVSLFTSLICHLNRQCYW